MCFPRFPASALRWLRSPTSSEVFYASVFVPSTKLRSLTGALQEAQSDAQAAEEGKEQSLYKSKGAGERGANHTNCRLYITYRGTGRDQVERFLLFMLYLEYFSYQCERRERKKRVLDIVPE